MSTPSKGSATMPISLSLFSAAMPAHIFRPNSRGWVHLASLQSADFQWHMHMMLRHVRLGVQAIHGDAFDDLVELLMILVRLRAGP